MNSEAMNCHNHSYALCIMYIHICIMRYRAMMQFIFYKSWKCFQIIFHQQISSSKSFIFTHGNSVSWRIILIKNYWLKTFTLNSMWSTLKNVHSAFRVLIYIQNSNVFSFDLMGNYDELRACSRFVGRKYVRSTFAR